MTSVDDQIRTASANISSNIAALQDDRGLLSQNMLSQLRNLVEAVAVHLHVGSGDGEFDYDLTGPAITWVGSANRTRNFLFRFHKLLQMSASHYTLEGDASERLMLKYYEFLLRTRDLVRADCGLDILENLEDFPVDLDPSLRLYHEKIATQIEAARALAPEAGQRARYYLNRVQPFFTGGRIYYEVTFSTISDRMNKLDHILAFTEIDVTGQYAANLTLVDAAIDVLDQTMPITIIRDWSVSIRPCEFENFARLLGLPLSVTSGSSEYRTLMQYLTRASASLLNLMDMPDVDYERTKGGVVERARRPVIMPVLDAARSLIRQNRSGANVLRYLLLAMNNRVLKAQYWNEPSGPLSNLHLSMGCKPFDQMPFCTSLIGHNPRFVDLATSLDATERTHELLARRVKNNVEQRGMVYTPVADLEGFGDVDALLATYNSKLYYKHAGRQLIQDMKHVFMREFEDGTVSIIEKLQEFADGGVAGYTQAVERWLGETQLTIDDDAKREALKALFVQSRVALIYGAAGTGKSTMANYIANYFGDRSKLFLAHTNPAKDNLERRVAASNSEFRTIASHLWRQGRRPEYDVLVIDECSTVSNAEMLRVLEQTSFKLLVLVGDVYQIASIQFGNWFGLARSFVPKQSVFELTTPFRTKNDALLDFWSRVRNLEDGIEESIARAGYSAVLDQSLFDAHRDDEIILCLNYDGLYGINNVNRFLQGNSNGKALAWGVNTYKVGDPILFNDSERFRPVIFNNLKGRIVDIEQFADHVQFDVSLDRGVTSLDVDGFDLRYVEGSTVRFDVYQRGSTDDDDEVENTSVPFQVAYAVSIHKAQGLEYDSVKIVITDANEEAVSHSIFYTAVTRARDRLRIFWTPETERAVIGAFERDTNNKDVALMSSRRGLTPIK